MTVRVLTWSGRLEVAPSGLIADLAAGLSGSGVSEAALAVMPGSSLDLIGIATPVGADAERFATVFARLPVAVTGHDPEAVWDHLAGAARAAKSLMADRQIIAAAISFRGRGRLIGPLNGDVLLRFGVSEWR